LKVAEIVKLLFSNECFICYDNIKKIPLSRYTLDKELLHNNGIQDEPVLGWISEDVQQILPNAVRKCDFNLTKKRLESKNEMSDPSDEFAIIRVVQNEQIYRNMYGAIQRLIHDKEALERSVREFTAVVAAQQSQITALHDSVLSLQNAFHSLKELAQTTSPQSIPIASPQPSPQIASPQIASPQIASPQIASPQIAQQIVSPQDGTITSLQGTIATLQYTIATVLTKLV
jgi:uncharacterized coiled-coil protein SlyX